MGFLQVFRLKFDITLDLLIFCLCFCNFLFPIFERFAV